MLSLHRLLELFDFIPVVDKSTEHKNCRCVSLNWQVLTSISVEVSLKISHARKKLRHHHVISKVGTPIDGEVIPRIMRKCVMHVTKPDVIDASGSLQVCAEHKSGSEAAIHAMHNIFEADEMDAFLLIDSSNAFNALNRAAALHNIRVLCPTLATYVINTYRQPVRLFITGSEELISAEGTTQGDPLSMSLYGISLQPLITRLHVSSAAKQCWFADDATGSGSLQGVRKWLDELAYQRVVLRWVTSLMPRNVG